MNCNTKMHALLTSVPVCVILFQLLCYGLMCSRLLVTVDAKYFHLSLNLIPCDLVQQMFVNID